MQKEPYLNTSTRDSATRRAWPLLLALAVLAGCGGGGSGAGGPGSATQPAAPSSPPVVVNRAPLISGQLPAQALVGQGIDFTPQASDPDGDVLTFSASGLPPWLSLDPASGRVQGKPAAADVGTYSGIVLSVSDGRATSSLPVQTLVVVASASGKATLSWVPPTEHVDGTPLSDLAGYRIRYGTTPEKLDQLADIPNPGIVRYVIENLTPATWYFTVSAYTRAGVESERSTLASKTI